MRVDTDSFAVKNASLTKDPRFVVEIAFDPANTILWHLTSHDDCALPPGASAIVRVLQKQSVTSQTLNPDVAASTIGSMSLDVVDREGAVTTLLASQIELGRSTRRMRVRFYVGYEGDAWTDYSLVQTQLVQTITFERGVYRIACSDVQRSMRKDIFDPAKTTLFSPLGANELTVAVTAGAATLEIGDSTNFPAAGAGMIRERGDTDFDAFAWTGKTGTALTGCSGVLAHAKGALVCDATVEVYDTTTFEMVQHGTSYGDAPSATVGYVQIGDEVIRYASKNDTQFLGCTRGALSSVPVEHTVDPLQTQDQRPKVNEYVYLEMPAPKLIYALLTGVLYGQGGATLPDGWHLAIDPGYVRLADFTDPTKIDLWNPTDDLGGVTARFADLRKTDGKKFIETELYQLCGAFPIVYADGQIGLRRMANILAGAGYVTMLDESNLVSWSELTHDFDALHNILRVDWNWEPLQDKFTRVNVYADPDSVSKYGRSDPLNLKFLGLHGSRATTATLGHLFNALRDRYTGPPERITVNGLHRLNGLEVGDIARLRLQNVRDYLAPDGGGPIDRSFEVQQVTVDWKGKVSLKLFGSSQAPGAMAPTTDDVVLTPAWYASQGTPLTTTGSNPKHINSDVTLTGSADMNSAPSIFYCDGDLQLDATKTITIVGNVQLRIMGFFQVNGKIDGRAGGIAGAAALADPPATYTSYNLGTKGYIGTTKAGGGLGADQSIWVVSSFEGGVVQAPNAATPMLNLDWDGTTLSGIPADHRGSSGSSGMPFHFSPSFTGLMDFYGITTPIWAGGAGGASGAGLLVVCRGLDVNIAGSIDLSGGDGALGSFFNRYSDPNGGYRFKAGSGAGGAPGALTILLDGNNMSATGLTETGFVALYGKTPIPPIQVPSPSDWFDPIPGPAAPYTHDYYSFYVGTGDGSTFDLPSFSGGRGGARVQKIPGNVEAIPDPTFVPLPAPTGLLLSSGTSELLKQGDGTLLIRIKLLWTPANDARVVAYEIQVKESSQSEAYWHLTQTIFGRIANVGWIMGVRDGVTHDVRIRAAGASREVSEWLTVVGHMVVGKTEKPVDVSTLTYAEPVLSWSSNTTDPDLVGYVVRYQPSWSSADWGTALVPPGAGDQGFITATEFDTSKMTGGQVTMLAKCRDTTGNESAGVSSKQIDLRPPVPTGFSVSRQPDGTREFAWILASPPSDIAGFEVRYLLGSSGGDWDAMAPVHTGLLIASPFESNQLAAGTYDFAIKSVDRAGNYSATALFITGLTIGDPRIAGSIEDFKEEPDWTETKTSCHLDGATGWLVADGTGTWATAATWAAMGAWVVSPVGSIQYERKLDVGVVTSFIPLVTVLADSSGGAVTIEEAHSNTDSGYSAFAAIGPQLTARWVKIRVTVTGTFPKLKSERIILSATPVEEVIEDVVPSALTGSYRIGTGDIRLPITKPFSVIKKVDLTFQSVVAGDVWTWSLEDKTVAVGPHLKLYKAGVLADPPKIDATVKGI